MKNKIEGKRRESIPMQRGEARNYARVLSRLTSSGAMLVFLM